MKAKDFIYYIGCDCLIFDNIEEPEKGSSAYIEGIDVVANKVICERANFDPSLVKPILHPLNIINTDFFVDKFDSDTDVKNYLNEDFLQECGIGLYDNIIELTPEFLPLGIINLFLKYHIDVFELIPKGLAIEIKK